MGIKTHPKGYLINRLCVTDLRELSQKSDLERPYQAPKYWAAFICLGNPAALKKFL